MAPDWSVEVLDRRIAGPGVVALTMRAPQEFDARPGQFVLVSAGDLGGRHYTISSPDTDRTFEITVDLTPGSQVVDWLANRPPGATIDIEGPLGRTYYDGGDAVAIGGASGIGAAVAVAERAHRTGHATGVVAAGRSIHEQRLAALARAGVAVYSVDEDLSAGVRAVHGHGRAFVFGFRDFIDRVRTAAIEAGLDPSTFAIESYGPR